MDGQDIGRYIENADDNGSARKKRTGKRCCLIAGCAWFDKLIDQHCEQREAGQSGPLQLSTAAAWTENTRRRAKFYGEMGPRRRMKFKCIHKKGGNAWISVSLKSPILIPEIVEEVGCAWLKRWTVDGYTTALAIRPIGVLLLWSWWNKRVGSVRAHCQWSVSHLGVPFSHSSILYQFAV